VRNVMKRILMYLVPNSIAILIAFLANLCFEGYNLLKNISFRFGAMIVANCIQYRYIQDCLKSGPKLSILFFWSSVIDFEQISTKLWFLEILNVGAMPETNSRLI